MKPVKPRKSIVGKFLIGSGVILGIVIGALFARSALMPQDFLEIQLTDKELSQVKDLTAGMEIKPREGVGSLRFKMTPKEVISLLGLPEYRLDDPSIPQTLMAYRKLGLFLAFDTGGAELRAIICMSDGKEALFSKRNKPATTFAGATREGIRIGSTLEVVKKSLGIPDSSTQYFPERRGQPFSEGDVIEHAYFQSLMILEKDGRVVEIHCVLPGWRNPPLDNANPLRKQ